MLQVHAGDHEIDITLGRVENPCAKLRPPAIDNEAPLGAEVDTADPLFANLKELPVGFPLSL